MAKNEMFLHARKRGHSVVENALLDDNRLTGMAKYLLIQFCSHREGEWKIQMSDVIKRSKNGRDAHYTALTELIHNNYVARVRVTLKGTHKELIYIYGQVKEDVKELLDETVKIKESEGYRCRIEYGKPHTENPNVVPEVPEPTKNPLPEKPDVDKADSETKYITNNQVTKYQDTNHNMNNEHSDDDKRTPPSEGSAPHSEEEVNIIINTLREATKDDLSQRSFKSVLRKVMDKYNQGKVGNLRDYLTTSLINKIEELELRRIKENAKSALKQSKLKNAEERRTELNKHTWKGELPFYNWLDE